MMVTDEAAGRIWENSFRRNEECIQEILAASFGQVRMVYVGFL